MPRGMNLYITRNLYKVVTLYGTWVERSLRTTGRLLDMDEVSLG